VLTPPHRVGLQRQFWFELCSFDFHGKTILLQQRAASTGRMAQYILGRTPR